LHFLANVELLFVCVLVWRNGCATDEDKWVKIAVDRIRCSPWVTWIFLNCCIHLLFVGVLLGNMLYQVNI